jgi:O-methyltransferase
MADLLRGRGITDRKFWMFDSFEGLPPATEIDGHRALNFRAHPEDPAYFNNNTASLEEVEQASERLGLASFVEPVKGWFESTLPKHRGRIGQIALLRIDGDWYESVKICFEQLYDQVAPNGIIVLDDYYDWQGCSIATHEFLSRRQLPHRIWTQTAGRCAVIHKE